jgi:hypothetical protein
VSKFFDIPGRQFNFSNDLEYGLQGEDLISGFLDTLSNGDFEIKSDRYRNGRMVVETNQNPKGMTDANGNKVWVPSGINITTSKWWVYIYAPEGAFVVASVQRLKRYLRAHPDRYCEAKKRDFGGVDNPARGFLLEPNEVMDMLFNKQYDEQEKQ